MSDNEASSPSGSPPQPTAPAATYLGWPPPGLETIHAKLWPVIVVLAIGDAVLVLPLLWAVAGDWSFWSLGPFGASWWVLFVTSAIGLVALLLGFQRLIRLLLLAARAGTRGHGWVNVLQVAADTARDSGFVLQGARIYRRLDPAQRGRLLATRLVTAGAYLGAVLWVPFAFAVSVALASRGILGPDTVRLVTALVPAILVLVGLVSRVNEIRIQRPLMVSIASPDFQMVQLRITAAESYRRYRLEPDPTITDQAAGEAIHALSWVAIDVERGAIEQAPARTYDTPWFAVDEDSIVPHSDSLFDYVRRGLSARQRSEFRTVASHPAHREWEIAGVAAAADIIGTRFTLPLPDVSPATLPIPRFGTLRQGARAHFVKAAWELANGQTNRAELTIREVLSAGLLLADEAPLLIDNLVGAVLVRSAAEALESFYRATGQSANASSLEWLRTTTTNLVNRSKVFRGRPDPAEAIRLGTDVVLDTNVVPGLRWEMFLGATTFAPCLNLHAAVFGPGVSYETWLEQARASLIRRPSDEALFELMKHGWFGPVREAPGVVLGTLLRLTFGTRDASNVCGGELLYAYSLQ